LLLLTSSRLIAGLSSSFVRRWVSLFTWKSGTQHLAFWDIKPLPSILKEDGYACLLHDRLFVLGNLKQAGSFTAWARRASNPYPKAFFVSTSVCVTRNDEEASCCPHLHSGN
jgi:hypothetical protein